MTNQKAINELQSAIDLIKQDGKDWLDERDIPILEMAISALEKMSQLPQKHGRLIDADAFKTDYRMSDDCDSCDTNWKSCQYDTVYAKMDFCGWLDDAPTVIEAEDEA